METAINVSQSISSSILARLCSMHHSHPRSAADSFLFQFTSTCVWAYEATRSGLAPEIMQFWVESDSRRWETVQMAGEFFAARLRSRADLTPAPTDGSKARAVKGDPMGVHSGNNYHIQRPETIESVWYMYRLTGDRAWQVSSLRRLRGSGMSCTATRRQTDSPPPPSNRTRDG